MLFDHGMTGNFTYSSDLTYQYAKILGMPLIGFTDFWPTILKSLSGRFFIIAIIPGIVSLIYFYKTSGSTYTVSYLFCPRFLFLYGMFIYKS